MTFVSVVNTETRKRLDDALRGEAKLRKTIRAAYLMCRESEASNDTSPLLRDEMRAVRPFGNGATIDDAYARLGALRNVDAQEVRRRYLSNLYEVSELLYRHFDEYALKLSGCLQRIGELSSDARARVWLLARLNEEFARASCYRCYEYLRCLELLCEMERERTPAIAGEAKPRRIPLRTKDTVETWCAIAHRLSTVAVVRLRRQEEFASSSLSSRSIALACCGPTAESLPCSPWNLPLDESANYLAFYDCPSENYADRATKRIATLVYDGDDDDNDDDDTTRQRLAYARDAIQRLVARCDEIAGRARAVEAYESLCRALREKRATLPVVRSEVDRVYELVLELERSLR